MRLALLVLICCAAECAAATASGRNWRVAVDSLGCEGSLLTIGMRIGYLGPKGPVEAPVIQLAQRDGKPHPPKSLVWRSGSKPLAAWLSAGGLQNLQAEDVGEVQLKFELGGTRGVLNLEFGDIAAFAVTRDACEKLLKPGEIQAPRFSRKPGARLDLHVYRNTYPCTSAGGLRTIEANYPPYLPRQLLVFGRGYLPNARQIELPMGNAPAQSYAYAGRDDLKGIEDAARRAVAADFPELKELFAFNWGVQKAASGNEAYSIGLYELRACPK